MASFRTIVRDLSRHWLTVGFVLGFITDAILLNRVDDLLDNLILLTYVVLATFSLLLLYVGVAERVPAWLSYYLKRFSPMVMQYAFGGLLSGMLIFYGRSGDWVSSSPFFLLILVVIFGNEFVSKRSDRLVYHLALYFIGIFSYAVLILPVLTGHMGDWMFIASGFAALALVSCVIKLLYKIVPQFMRMNTRTVIVTIGTIYIGFNTLYFTSVIPPIPLSLTELSIVQLVEKFPKEETYHIQYEEHPWYTHLPFIHPVIHPQGEYVYCFARVYAPTKLSTNIYHQWEYKGSDGKWHKSFRFDYPVAGTNQGGYRGYTKTSNFFDGLWRCGVETERGQVLGREVFRIDTTGTPGRIWEVVE